MAFQIDRKDATEKLKHLDIAHLGKRAIPAFPVLLNDDFGKWGLWLPGPDGKLVRMQAGDPVEGSYFAKDEMEHEEDVYFHFVNVTTQHLSWPGKLGDATEALRNDALNLAAAVKTISWLHWLSVHHAKNTRRPAQVQLEFIIITCRSMYDLAQTFLCDFYKKVEWTDPELEKRRKGSDLPDSFAKMAIKAHERPLTKEEIAAQYAVPAPWVDFYAGEAQFLFALRALRDQIAHKGAEVPFLFDDNGGFLVDTKDAAVKRLYLFPKEHLLPGNPNELGALTSLIGFIVNRTLKMLEGLASMLQKFTLPPAVAPGYFVFIRDPHLHCLGEGELPVLPTDNPWYHHDAKSPP